MPLLVCVAEQGTGRGSAESNRHRSAGAPGVELIIYSVRHFDVFTGWTMRSTPPCISTSIRTTILTSRCCSHTSHGAARWPARGGGRIDRRPGGGHYAAGI